MSDTSNALPGNPPKLLDQVRAKIRLKHYSIRTEQAYTDRIKRFILYFGKQHPRDLGARDVAQLLTHCYCLPSPSLAIQCLGIIAHEIRESTLSSLA